MNKYLKPEWWYQYLESMYEKTLPSVLWNLDKTTRDSCVWFKKGESLIGVCSFDEGHRPSLVFCHRPESENPVGASRVFQFEYADEILSVIETMADPFKSYLCIGIEWADPIIESLLLNESINV